MASLFSSLRSMVSSAATIVDKGADTLTGTFTVMSEEVEHLRQERVKNRLHASRVNETENAQALRELIVADEEHAVKCAEALAKIEESKTDAVKAKLAALEAVMAAKYGC